MGEPFQNVHHGELHIGRGEWLSIMPFHALAQIECHCLAIGAHLIAFGKDWYHFSVIVVIEKTLIDLWHNQTDWTRS